jgi:hypothetical protein
MKNQLTTNAERYLNKFIQNKLNEINQNDIIFNIVVNEDWFSDVLNTIDEHESFNINDSISNPYCVGDFQKYLKLISKKIIFWTALLPFSLKSKKIEASSSHLESFHNKLQHRYLYGKKVEIDEVISVLQTEINHQLAFTSKLT